MQVTQAHALAAQMIVGEEAKSATDFDQDCSACIPETVLKKLISANQKGGGNPSVVGQPICVPQPGTISLRACGSARWQAQGLAKSRVDMPSRLTPAVLLCTARQGPLLPAPLRCWYLEQARGGIVGQ